MSGSFELVLSEEELHETVARLGEEVSRDYPGGLLCVGVLKGCVPFLADLLRRLSIDCELDFLALSSYRPGETRVRIVKDLDADVSGKHVLLVEDIIDTGLSASYVQDLLSQRGAAEVAICTLIDRPSRRILPVRPNYVGIQVQEQFVVGYGLDFAERYRNLPTLYSAALEDLEAGIEEYFPGP